MRSKALFALVLWVACGPKPAPRSAGPAPELAQLVELEARREAGATAMIELTSNPDATVRLRAVRALGRIDSPRARTRLRVLTAAESRVDGPTRNAAIWAMGIAGGDEAEAEAHLIALYPGLPTAAARAVLLEALGRVGGPDSLTLLTASLQDGEATVRAAGGLALGVFGRRSIALDDGVRRALRGSAGHVDSAVAYAVAYALAREHQPPDDAATRRVLLSLAHHADAETRAVALLGLGRRSGAEAASFAGALQDSSWLVRLQAVRGLARAGYGTTERALLATQVAREWAVVAGRPGANTHVLVEGLRALAPYAREPLVAKMADKMAERAAARIASAELRGSKLLVAGMVHCMTSALQVRRGESIERVLQCGGKSRMGWPRHARRRLALELIWEPITKTDGADKPESADDSRLAVWRQLLADRDPRVRAAALEQFPAAAERGLAVEADYRVLLSSVREPNIEVSGTAADLIARLLGPNSSVSSSVPQPLRAALVDALIERARKGATDVELELTYLAAIRDGAFAGGGPLCNAALSRPHRAVRAIARECVKALGGAAGPEGAVGSPEPPPVIPSILEGKRVSWSLSTTRGQVAIELDPTLAPWHVAMLVKLTRDGFYDGLMWHRVVPGFVVQGGAPGDSAWGGPGFVVPGEASAARFDAGVVGIADAGPDTGGSQFFIMHARAPHLEARYTVVGRVTTPMSIVNALQVGDRILSARISVK